MKLTIITPYAIINLMEKKPTFKVDSQGTTEPIEVREKPAPGLVVGQEGEVYTDPTSKEAIDNASYYIDPGGRKIDTKTGQEVTPDKTEPNK
jgi:hypothetical protein